MLDTRFKGKVAVVTGGAQGIGKAIADRLSSEGAEVEIIDIQDGPWFVGDIADPETCRRFAEYVVDRHGRVDILVNNALPLMKGIDECTWDEFLYAMKVGVAAPFFLAKLFRPHLAEGSAIVNISSTRASMSQAQTESYAAAKGGIAALTHALAVSLGPVTRVNSIAPGWIDTVGYEASEADRRQHPSGRIGRPEDIAAIVAFLASEEAGFITGENITVDGGMSRLMIYHNDKGWHLE